MCSPMPDLDPEDALAPLPCERYPQCKPCTWPQCVERPTCHFAVGVDFHSLVACGEPAVARFTDGATDEVRYTCAAHQDMAEGHYELEWLADE